VPVIRNWPGADSIYDRRWIRDSPEAMADAILEVDAFDRWAELGQLGHDQVHDSFALSRVVEAWLELLRSNLPAYKPVTS
jgi:hypothetical protein